MVKFLTAAFGTFYTETALRGMVRSFVTTNSPNSLIVYVDVIPDWAKEIDVEVRLFPKHIIDKIQNSQKTFFELTSFKYDLIDGLLKEDPTLELVWIDSDSLVLGDLLEDVQEGKIGFINHGSCKDDEIFDCGNGLKVLGKDFAIGGYFHIPNEVTSDFLIQLTTDRNSWAKDEKAYWFQDGEQSLLNHAVYKDTHNSYKINEKSVYNWEFLEGRHPYPLDKGLAKIYKKDNNFFTQENKKIKLLCWSSLTLLRHSKQGYRALDKNIAKQFRETFYKGCPRMPNAFMQRLYLLYDYFFSPR